MPQTERIVDAIQAADRWLNRLTASRRRRCLIFAYAYAYAYGSPLNENASRRIKM